MLDWECSSKHQDLEDEKTLQSMPDLIFGRLLRMLNLLGSLRTLHWYLVPSHARNKHPTMAFYG